MLRTVQWLCESLVTWPSLGGQSKPEAQATSQAFLFQSLPLPERAPRKSPSKRWTRVKLPPPCDLLPCLLQETVPTTRREAGGITPVPTPTSMGSGTAGAITGAATRTESTGLSSEEAPTRSRKW